MYLQEVGWGMEWLDLAQNWNMCRVLKNVV